jgi:thiol-disulfide isomerase/thioredoxin
MKRIIPRIAAVSLGLTTLACLVAVLPAGITGATPNAGAAWAAGLGLGDRAPAMVVKAFVKGTPVPSLPKGKISVVEFWATWCGPCKESIPHLTEMAKKYPQVTFVGVSVWEEDQSKVVPFVKEMGAKMNYHVAMDKVAPGAKGEAGVMAKTWMEAAGQDGIPTAFIVGKDGRIAWIGHPMEMAEPLAKITAGKWNVATAMAEAKKKQAEDKELEALQSDLQKAAATHDPKQILAAIDKGIAANPELEKEQLGLVKFTMMKETDPAGALTYGKHLVSDVYKDNIEALNALAWPLVDPDAKTKATPELVALALQAAKQGDTLAHGKNGEIADTLAAACFASGDTAGAIADESRAIKLAGTGNAEEVAQMKKNLVRYKGAGK